MADGIGERVSGFRFGTWLATTIALLPSVIAFAITVVLILASKLTFRSLSDQSTLNSLALLVLFLLAGLAVGYSVRVLLPRELLGGSLTAGAADPKSSAQARIAIYVVVGGTTAILATALTIIIAIAIGGGNWQERAVAVFTSILPVFSTWVGTVLAFYFSNESFKQGQQSGQAEASSADTDPITRPGTMIPYDRIIRHEMKTGDIGTRDAKVAAEDIPLAVIRSLFSPPGIVRIVIFDDKKVPLFVVRHESLPLPVGTGDTLKTYLDAGANRTAAGNFAWTGTSASIADARRLLEIRKVTDLFVTDHGRNDEPTLGWVPDDNLKKA